MGRRISLHLDDTLVNDLLKFTGEKSAAKALRRAAEELIERERKARIGELRSMFGKTDLDLDWYRARHGPFDEPSSPDSPVTP